MKYMLDTNICSYIIKHNPPEVLSKFKNLHEDDCVISSVTVSELKYWIARNNQLHKTSKNTGTPKFNEMIVNDFISRLPIVDYDLYAAEVYGWLRVELESKGTTIGNMDLMIGAHAISLKMTLVTNNLKEFNRLHSHGLQLENWVKK